jgi:uncharacterized protein
MTKSASLHETPFWKGRALEDFSKEEWERLCDGCGRCCLVKLEDEDTGDIHFTNVGCKLLDGKTCRCTDYHQRRRRVRDCVKLTPKDVRSLKWLPPTCAYKLIADGQDLKWWHPLVSGSTKTVHEAGISVKAKVAASETDVPVEDLPDFIVSWPAKFPKGAK